MSTYRCAAPCLFGLESLVAKELEQMGAQEVNAQNGRVLFSGNANMVARANIRLRCAERVEIVVGQFRAVTFQQLIDGSEQIAWEQYLREDDAFPVAGWSRDSKLFSVPDCQAIIKKAAVNRMAKHYGIARLPETGPKVQIRFSILKDEVTVLLDTSGVGLHKRGYRENSTEAPIKETLAAGMAMLARLYDDSVVYDPFCGSGTLLIESAMLARNIAPGIRRAFSAERWGFLPREIWTEERMAAISEIKKGLAFRCVGSDIDPKAVELTLQNAKKAGVADCFTVTQADAKDFCIPTPRGVVLTNPPYGERLLDQAEAKQLTQLMGKVFVKDYGKRYLIISPDEEFETLFGRKADKRRKLYNGMIPCQLYLYYQ